MSALLQDVPDLKSPETGEGSLSACAVSVNLPAQPCVHTERERQAILQLKRCLTLPAHSCALYP